MSANDENKAGCGILIMGVVLIVGMNMIIWHTLETINLACELAADALDRDAYEYHVFTDGCNVADGKGGWVQAKKLLKEKRRVTSKSNVVTP